MAKRKKGRGRFVEEEDVNDGSNSDQSQDGYVPRARAQHIENVPHQEIRVSSTGQRRSTIGVVPVPASPSKRSRISRSKPDAEAGVAQDEIRVDWDDDFAEFDAEYGPGLERAPRQLRDSVGDLSARFGWSIE
jgi:hypothetical protein